MRRATALFMASLCLAACHDKQADTGKSAAAAEVLPGSASDAMIAYDTLKSQPPMAIDTAAPDDRADGSKRRGPGSRATDAAISADPSASPVGAANEGQAPSTPAR